MKVRTNVLMQVLVAGLCMMSTGLFRERVLVQGVTTLSDKQTNNHTRSEEMIRGINYYGLETPARDFVCGWQHRPSYYLEKLDAMKFNSIRLPFSLEYVKEGDFSKMDEFFEALSHHPKMTVVLDMHRVFSSHQGPTPTESGVTMKEFLHGWETIIRRYEKNPQLVGIDVFNEYQGTDSNYWNRTLREIVTGLEQAFPNRFLFYVGGTRWGGDIAEINLETLPFHDRIRYTIHKYIFSTAGYNREQDWDWSFGKFKDVPRKVSVGEWGFKSDRWDEVEWAKQFIKYLKKHNIRDTYFWTIAHSGDTGGLWFDNCEEVDQEKYKIIKSLWESDALAQKEDQPTLQTPKKKQTPKLRNGKD